ncbi:hypothetical protein HK100_006707 [Physocladia obscura]|uniref:Uncharacterized protein n=1 Tax=Physocladia obscura TaxID=109957 RepID=A0AAD5SVS2_9FUNG|nr:hypothetical protein HK100_006707 [Physocladia obscura]
MALQMLSFSNHLIYAYVNVIWVRTIEKVLADFVTDKDRNTHHHMISKPASIKFIVTLAPYYGLDSEVVDVSWGNAKTSVILRKRVRNGWCGIPNVALSSIAQHYRALASVAEANGGIPVTGAYNAIIAGNTGSVGDIPHDSDNSEGQNLADFNPPSASTEVPLSLPPVSSVKIAVNGYQITNLSRALEDRDLVDLLEPILKLPVSITWLEISDTRNDCVIQLVETENMSQVEYILVNSSNKVFNLLVMDGLAEDVELCWMTHKQVITATAEIHTKKPAKSFKRPAQTKKDSIGHESKFSALKYDFPDE